MKGKCFLCGEVGPAFEAVVDQDVYGPVVEWRSECCGYDTRVIREAETIDEDGGEE